MPRVAFLFLLGIRLLYFILNPEWGNFGSKYWYYLCFSILFYYISISGLINLVQINPNRLVGINEDEIIDEEVSTDHVDAQENNFSEVYKTQIETLMTDKKIYKNPYLTLFDLSSELNITAKDVSHTINKGFGMNFNDFINTYRIKEIIEGLQSGKASALTLLSIAMEAGFNSKSTFNRAFKKNTQLTPKEYLQKNINK